MERNLTKDKNADRLILNQIEDDKDLLETCSSSKYLNSLCDETFFRNRLMTKYPLLYQQYKNNNISNYKKLYLQLSYYLGLLWENYKIPYIPAPNFNPIIFYKKYVGTYLSNEMYGQALYYAALSGDKNLIDYFLNELGLKFREGEYNNLFINLMFDNKIDLKILRYILIENGKLGKNYSPLFVEYALERVEERGEKETEKVLRDALENR